MTVRKYRNTPTVIDGIRFDSKGEARRFQDLKLLERGGVLANVERQVSFRLEVNGVLIAFYRADFVYTDKTLGRRIVEDFKGVRTDVYRLKKALMKACHGIDILETGSPRPVRPMEKAA